MSGNFGLKSYLWFHNQTRASCGCKNFSLIQASGLIGAPDPPGRTLPLDPPQCSWSDLNEAFSISIFHSYFAGLWGANDCFCPRRPVISCNISCTWEVSRTCDHTIYGTGGCLPCRGRHLSFDSARKYGRKQLSKSEQITSCRIYGILFV